jgi:hypothetical protein
MKQGQYIVVITIGAACLLAAISLLAVGSRNRALQQELQEQQQIFNKALLAQQYMAPVLQDMAAAGAANPKITALMKKHLEVPQERPKQ